MQIINEQTAIPIYGPFQVMSKEGLFKAIIATKSMFENEPMAIDQQINEYGMLTDTFTSFPPDSREQYVVVIEPQTRNLEIMLNEGNEFRNTDAVNQTITGQLQDWWTKMSTTYKYIILAIVVVLIIMILFALFRPKRY